jgi:hypothetical protein
MATPRSESFSSLSTEDQVHLVKSVVQDIVDNWPGGRKALAGALRVSYNTLSRWCNEFMVDYCIPPHMIVNLYHLHPDPRLIQFLCRHTHHLAVPTPKTVADLPELAMAVGISTKEFGEMLQEIGRALSHSGPGGPSITTGELEQVRKEVHEAMASIAALLKAVEMVSEIHHEG